MKPSFERQTQNIASLIEREPLIIAGPCSAETREQLMQTGEGLKKIGVKVMRAGIWKPRTRPGGFEGWGPKALDWFNEVKDATGLLIATEVATPVHVEEALKAGVDIFWIGARTTGNPFAVQELADALKGVDIPVLIKNPVSPQLELWVGAIERFHRAGLRQIGAIHRGFYTYGEKKYRNTPVWEVPRNLHEILPSLPVFTDPSHISGKREYVAALSQEALDFDFDGLLIETHCNPEKAWTDASQQVSCEQLGNILGNLKITQRKRTIDFEQLSHEIDGIDGADLKHLA